MNERHCANEDRHTPPTFSERRTPAKNSARKSPRPPRRTTERQSHAVAKAPADPRSGRYPTGFQAVVLIASSHEWDTRGGQERGEQDTSKTIASFLIHERFEELFARSEIA